MVAPFSGHYNEKNGEFLPEILNYVIKCESFEKIRPVIKTNQSCVSMTIFLFDNNFCKNIKFYHLIQNNLPHKIIYMYIQLIHKSNWQYKYIAFSCFKFFFGNNLIK